MTWDYRILEHKNVDGTSWFAIHEVYYDGAGTPELCSEEPCFAHGEDAEILITDMEYMMKALIKPVLSYNHFGNKE
jgi:hypothetical protein